MLDSLIRFGASVKDLGNGKVGGYLVMFGNPSTTDLAGDYFTKDTDFSITWADDGTTAIRSMLLYNHGLDPVMKKAKLSDDGVSMKLDDTGIWVEGQIAQRNAYEQAIYGMVKSSDLGWSSGTASHLVERKRVGYANEITAWPLGLDASLTPTPCEPRNDAIPLKYWAAETPFKSLLENYPNIRLSMTFGAVCRLQDYVWDEVYDSLWGGATAEGLADLQKSFQEFSDLALEVIRAIMGSDDATKTAAKTEFEKLIRRKSLQAGDVKTERDFERFLRDAGYSRTQATAITANGYKTLSQRDADDAGEPSLIAALKSLAETLKG